MERKASSVAVFMAVVPLVCFDGPILYQWERVSSVIYKKSRLDTLFYFGLWWGMELEKFIKLNELCRTTFARKIGISRQALHNISKNGAKPSLKTALAIERLTKGFVTLREMVGK